ncbi:MAG: dependent oxidoreductase, partial [Clostridiales bacterium]|nr:dependent oxidoreductase [Clostridiales bacterium]
MRKDIIIRMLIVSCLVILVFQFGIKPLFQQGYYIEARKLHSWAEGKLTKDDGVYDVVVVGAEPEGISAAISAARLGAKTLLMAEGGSISATLIKNLY